MWEVKPDESGYNIFTSFGHATLKEERFLVTHNHYGVLNAIQVSNDPDPYVLVTVSDCNEESIFSAPLTDFEIAWQDPETLVLAYKGGQLAQEIGASSAEFQAWPTLQLEVGLEVAQVDWDGQTTRVDWASVKDIEFDSDPPKIILDSYATSGASGGGVFLQGKHIGNNWCHLDYPGQPCALVEFATIVALNSVDVVNCCENGD